MNSLSSFFHLQILVAVFVALSIFFTLGADTGESMEHHGQYNIAGFSLASAVLMGYAKYLHIQRVIINYNVNSSKRKFFSQRKILVQVMCICICCCASTAT